MHHVGAAADVAGSELMQLLLANDIVNAILLA